MMKYNPIFIVGSGRTGTHLVAEIMKSAPRSRVYVEDPSHFPLINKAVLCNDQKSLRRLFQILQKNYQDARKKGEVMIDKTHPLLWYVSELTEMFPTCGFIATQRDIESTIASMLKHKGVMAHYRNPHLYFPNRFLGISSKSEMARLNDYEKCKRRIEAHRKHIEWCRDKKYPFFIFDYDSFCTRPRTAKRQDLLEEHMPERADLEALEQFLGIAGSQLRCPEIKYAFSVAKYPKQNGNEEGEHLQSRVVGKVSQRDPTN
jgi:hypothetical protein